MIGKLEFAEYPVFRWVSISRHKDEYKLFLHDVFDDRPEIASIYYFSYFEPDDLYGRDIQVFDLLDDALEAAEKLYNASRNKYMVFGYLDEALQEYGDIRSSSSTDG